MSFWQYLRKKSCVGGKSSVKNVLSTTERLMNCTGLRVRYVQHYLANDSVRTLAEKKILSNVLFKSRRKLTKVYWSKHEEVSTAFGVAMAIVTPATCEDVCEPSSFSKTWSSNVGIRGKR